MHILTTYLEQYQRDLRSTLGKQLLRKDVGIITVRYRDHARKVSLALKTLALYTFYHPSPTSLLIRQLNAEARFHLLLAFEDVRGFDYLAEIHSLRRSSLEKQAAHTFADLVNLHDCLDSAVFLAPSSPPSRSA